MSNINVRTDTKALVINVLGWQRPLTHIPSTEPPANRPSATAPVSEKKQLWHNDQMVSASIIERALGNNGYEMAAVFYNKKNAQVKIVFLPKAEPDNEMYYRIKLSEEQREEAKSILKHTFTFCHAQYFSAPVPNIQIALLKMTHQNPLLQITIRNGELTTTLTKNLTSDERDEVSTRDFASRLVGRA